jgi:low affinity Fe/Cu permease
MMSQHEPFILILEFQTLRSRFVLLGPHFSISAIGIVIGTLTLTIVHYSVEIVAFIRTATTVVVQTSILLQVLLGFLVPFLLQSFITSRLIKDLD